jgi:hypothetical protein
MIQNILQTLQFTRIFKCFYLESSDSLMTTVQTTLCRSYVVSRCTCCRSFSRSSTTPFHQSTCHKKWTSEILPSRTQPSLSIIMKSSSLFSQPQRNPISQLPSAVHRSLHSPITSLRDISPFLLTRGANHGLKRS